MDLVVKPNGNAVFNYMFKRLIPINSSSSFSSLYTCVLLDYVLRLILLSGIK